MLAARNVRDEPTRLCAALISYIGHKSRPPLSFICYNLRSVMILPVRGSPLHLSISKVDKLMKKYKGNYAEMFKRLDAKYNRAKSVRLRRTTAVETVLSVQQLARHGFIACPSSIPVPHTCPERGVLRCFSQRSCRGTTASCVRHSAAWCASLDR